MIIIIRTFTLHQIQYCWGDKIQGVLDSAYSVHRTSAEFVQKICWEASKRRKLYKDLGIDGKIIIHWIYRIGKCGMDYFEDRGKL
jgi:hypothetical protein